MLFVKAFFFGEYLDDNDCFMDIRVVFDFVKLFIMVLVFKLSFGWLFLELVRDWDVLILDFDKVWLLIRLCFWLLRIEFFKLFLDDFFIFILVIVMLVVVLEYVGGKFLLLFFIILVLGNVF